MTNLERLRIAGEYGGYQMKIMTKLQTEPEQRIIVNLVLTGKEIERLKVGDVVSGEEEAVFIQIVGYGEEQDRLK